MKSERLERLRALAADERTPIEEARNVALLYVRGGGTIELRGFGEVNLPLVEGIVEAIERAEERLAEANRRVRFHVKEGEVSRANVNAGKAVGFQWAARRLREIIGEEARGIVASKMTRGLAKEDESS